MGIEIAKLTRMLEAEKAALEGWGDLSDVEKAAYVAAHPGSFMATAAKKLGGHLEIETGVPGSLKKYLHSVGAPVHNIEKPYGSMDSHIVHTSWNPSNAHKIHKYLTNPRSGYSDGYEDDPKGLMESMPGGAELHKHVTKYPKPTKAPSRGA